MPRFKYSIKLNYLVYEPNRIATQEDIFEYRAPNAIIAGIQALEAIKHVQSNHAQIVNLQLSVTLVHDVSRGEDGL
jgi:hypothetical protein